MKDWINQQLTELLEASDLPSDTMQRARCFAIDGDLNQLLYELPLPPDELIAAGEVVAGAPSLQTPFPPPRASRTPAPTLPDATCYRLMALVEDDGACVDAALYILTQNLKAHAFNRARSTYGTSSHRPTPSSKSPPSHRACSNTYSAPHAYAV